MPRPNSCICGVSLTSSASETPRTVAVTGASGFIGRHLVASLQRAGYVVRVMMRRVPRAALWGDARPQIVNGSLDDVAALRLLLQGADAVIHLAGLIKATSRQAYMAVNRDGTERLAVALRDVAPDARLLHVSTLAAREPQLSDYAASKRAGEDLLHELLGPRALILRPAAVYGPGDRETLVFFQLAAGRWAPLLASPQARAALIHVSDLCSLMQRLITSPPLNAERPLAAADARPDGYSWHEILSTAAQAVGNPGVRLVQAPLPLLKTLALSGDLASRLGNPNLMTSQKLRELRHPDWSVAADEQARLPGWTPHYDLAGGFADAVRGYRALGWLKPDKSAQSANSL